MRGHRCKTHWIVAGGQPGKVQGSKWGSSRLQRLHQRRRRRAGQYFFLARGGPICRGSNRESAAELTVITCLKPPLSYNPTWCKCCTMASMPPTSCLSTSVVEPSTPVKSALSRVLSSTRKESAPRITYSSNDGPFCSAKTSSASPVKMACRPWQSTTLATPWTQRALLPALRSSNTSLGFE